MTKIFPSAVNYKTSSGSFAPINASLVKSGGGYAQVANDLGVLLPGSAAAPARVSDSSGSLAFGLEGASGAGTVSGTVDQFAASPSALGLSYSSLNTGVGWSVSVPASATGGSLSWLVNPSSGLSAKLMSGGVAFENSAGKVVWLFRAPVAKVAGSTRPTPTRLSLSTTTQGTVITVSLAKGSRTPGGASSSTGSRKPAVYRPGGSSAVFVGLGNPNPTIFSGEVVPGIYSGPGAQTGDCYVDSGTPDTSLCVENANYVGPNDHTLINFDVTDNLPQHVQLLQAFAAMYETSTSTNSSDNVAVYQAGTPWTNFATWNSPDGAAQWQTPSDGGDTTGAAEDIQSIGDPAYVNSWKYWDVFPSMQGWVDGSPSEVDGLIFEATSGTSTIGFDTETTSGYGPYLSVYYEPRMGHYPGARYASQRLTDRSSVGVNVANGNLLVSNNDVQMAGINGLGLNVGRYYNNLSSDQDSFGIGWSMGAGADTLLAVPCDTEQAVGYFDGSGNAQLFRQDASGNPVAPPGMDAKFSMNSYATWASTSFSILFRHSGITETFTSPSGCSSVARLSSISDRSNNKITYNYNSSSQLTSIVDTYGNAPGGTPSSHTTTIGWSTAGYVSQITDPSGRNSYYYQNTSGQLTSYKDPAGNTTYYTYDSYGNLTQVKTPQGNIVNVAYDAGNTNVVTSVTRLVNPTDASGPTTSFQYGAPSGSCPTNAGWTQASVADPNTHTNVFCTDDKSRITGTKDGNGHTRSTSYSDDGYIASVTNALTSPTTTTFTYSQDGNDNLQQIEQGSGSTGVGTKFENYPSSGSNQFLPTDSIDPQGNRNDYTYDSSTGNLTSTKEHASQVGTSETYHDSTYNAPGTVATSKDGKGNTTTYDYTNGNLTTITPPSGSGLNATTLTYDSANRVKTISTVAGGNGHKVCYDYDALDRVTKAQYSDASGTVVATITYSYDNDGNRLTRTDPHGTMTYSYDGLDRLTSQVQGSPNDATTTYTYDAANNLTSLTDAGGKVTYGYDHANQLTTVTDPGASLHTSLTYDNDGNLLKVVYPSGASVTRGYDTNDRLQSVTDTYKTSTGTLKTLSYTYDYKTAAGVMTNLRQTVTDQAGTKTTYTYDTFNRLTDASTAGGPDYHYTLDNAGNITAADLNGTTTNYTYNTANEISTANGHGYSYDVDGNETSNGNGLSMGYNALGQMTSITSAGTTTNYDYYGERNNEIESEAGHDLHSDLLGLASHDNGTGTDYFTRNTSGQLIDERLANGTYNYLYDGNGSIVGLIDSQGHLANQYAYDPYGNQTTHTGTTTNYFNFQSGYQTSGGLYHYGARYETPTDARWTQQDPMQHISSLTQSDRYAFSGDNAINYSDPAGTCSYSTAVCLGASNGLGAWGASVGTLAGGIASEAPAAGLGLGLLGGVAGTFAGEAITGSSVGQAGVSSTYGAAGSLAGTALGYAVGGPVGGFFGGLAGGALGSTIGDLVGS